MVRTTSRHGPGKAGAKVPRLAARTSTPASTSQRGAARPSSPTSQRGAAHESPVPAPKRASLSSPASSPSPASSSSPASTAPATRGAGARRALTVVDDALKVAAALTKSRGPEGRESLVGPRQVDRVRAVLARAAPAVCSALADVVAAVDGPGAAVGRGLVLKAVAARAPLLLDDGTASAALDALRSFAARVRPMSAADLLRRATVLDLDGTKNDGALDPLVLWERRGTIAAPRMDDDDADNDGLFQRFTGSCGPTTLQMMIAEADPIAAFAVHDAGLQSMSTRDAVAGEQRAMLSQVGMKTDRVLGRAEAHLRARVNNALGRLTRSGAVAAHDAAALRAHLFERAPGTRGARTALAGLRGAFALPTPADVRVLRAGVVARRDEGISVDALVALLNARVGPTTGERWRVGGAAQDIARGGAGRHLDDVARALRRGVDVPVGTSEPAHWMLLSAVRGRRPHRAFLVSDPDGGRTVWVDERALVRGKFIADQLRITLPHERPYVDCFILPTPTPTP